MKAAKRIKAGAIMSAIILLALASCKNSSNNAAQAGDEYGFKQPVVTPLILSKPQKINWAKVKTVTVTPVTAKFDVSNVPAEPYTDTTAFKPFKYPVETGKFDYKALPSKDLDINKLPSKPLKFAPAIINKPQLTFAGAPRPSAKSKGLLSQLSEAQGLAGVIVTCVFTDREGFLWVATDKGLYRYDGQNLVLYIPDPLSRIFCMLEDQSGQLWMSSLDGGIAMLDPKTGVLKGLSEKEGLASDKTVKMLIDNQQRIWVDNSKGINIINTKTKTISLLGKAQGLSSVPAAFLAADHNNNIWVDAFCTGLNIIDLKANKIRYLKKPQGLFSDSSSTVFCDRQGRIWASSALGVYLTVFDMQHGTWQHINELKDLKKRQGGFSIIEGTSQDNDGNIWIPTAYNGVTVINPEKALIKKIVISGRLGDQADFAVTTTHDKNGNTWIGTVNGLYVYKPTPRLLEHIKNYAVSTIAEDDNGLLWEGEFGGVHIADRKNKLIRSLTTKYGLVNDSVQNILKINGKMVVCTNNGADIFDQATKTVESFNTKQGLPFRQIQNVLFDRSGNYIISSGAGILVFNRQKGTARLITKNDGLSDNNITDLTLDAGDKIWSGVQNGAIDVIDLAGGTIRHLDQPGLRSNGTKLFLHNGSGNVWVGTTKGAYMIDQKKNTLTTFSTSQGLIDQAVISLLQYGDNIYVGSNGGISVINPPTGGKKDWKVTPFGKDDGLNKNNTGYYLSDNITKDGFYIFGDNGITIADLSPKADHFFEKALITGFSLMDRQMYYAYQPDTVEKNRDNPEEKVTGPYNLPVNLELPHDQNNFQFHFTALNPVKLDTAWFRYMLEGADQNWSSRTSDHSTGNYFGLLPGKYTFSVSALSHNGIWGPPASFTFIILPPWWQTWWARALFLLIFIAVIWGFVYYRSLSLIKEKRILEDKVNDRTKEVMEQKEEIASQRDSLQHALDDLKSTQSQLVQREKMASLGELTAGIAHEIQNPLNFVNNFSEISAELLNELQTGPLQKLPESEKASAAEIINDLTQNLEKISHHGKRADGIVKGMLQHSRAGSTTKEPTDINKLADEYLRLAYHGLRAKDKTFNSEMRTDFGANLPLINVVPQDVGRVLLNLFTNAFYAVQHKQKTAAKGFRPEVSVSTAVEKKQIVIKVKDNGSGIPNAIKDKIMQPFFTTKPAGEGTGLGLSLSYDIVVKGHGGKIDLDTREGEYTEFIITLPIA